MFKAHLGPYIGGKTFKDNMRFRQFCVKTLTERKRAEVARASASSPDSQKKHTNDMFQHLLNGRDSETGQGYTQGDLACETALLIIAGSQSTSGALGATLFYLANCPEKLARLRREIRDAFASEEEIRYEAGGASKLANLPYLQACLNESMRLTPPTPGHLQREVVGKSGMTIDGHWVPSGSNVGVSVYALHRNKEYFPDPGRFYPERLLGSGTDAPSYNKRATAALNPFSAGPTGCIGKQLALMELSLAIAMLLYRFDLRMQQRSCDGANGGDLAEYCVEDRFVGIGDGPWVRLVRDGGAGDT